MDKKRKYESQASKEKSEIHSLKAALREDRKKLDSMRRLFREEHVDTEEESDIVRELGIERRRKEKIVNELHWMKTEYEELKMKHGNADANRRLRKRVKFLEV